MRQLNNTQFEALVRLQWTVAEAVDDFEVFDEACRAADQCIGHKLFTILLLDSEAMEVQRLFSSNPSAYPPGGRKQKKDTLWGRKGLEAGEPYIGVSADDIRQHFHDHQVILGLDLESILNMPIRLGGQTVGTMNLLDKANSYSEEHLPVAALLAGLIAARIRS